MTEIPIIFSAPMVRAILSDDKTQTRRLMAIRGHKTITEFGPSDTKGYDWHFRDAQKRWHDLRADELMKRLPYAVGDRLWVREAFALVGNVDPGFLLYRASGYEQECQRHGLENCPPESDVKWRPSIHMPRWASRITLEVTEVRVQRLKEISEEDAKAEGAEEVGYIDECDVGCRSYVEGFARLWNRLHGPDAWAANPWVVAVTFKRVE